MGCATTIGCGSIGSCQAHEYDSGIPQGGDDLGDMPAADFGVSLVKYTLRSLPGQFSGLNLVALMYVAAQQRAPGLDVGFDLAQEYAMALGLRGEPSDTE